jgi:hypothetical protein
MRTTLGWCQSAGCAASATACSHHCDSQISAASTMISFHNQHHHSHQDSQRAERLWDGASQLVVVQVQRPAVALEVRRHSVAQHHQCPRPSPRTSWRLASRATLGWCQSAGWCPSPAHCKHGGVREQLTASQDTTPVIRVTVQSQHHHSLQAGQRAERLWNGASQIVDGKDQIPAGTTADMWQRRTTPSLSAASRHSLQASQRAERLWDGAN